MFLVRGLQHLIRPHPSVCRTLGRWARPVRALLSANSTSVSTRRSAAHQCALLSSIGSASRPRPPLLYQPLPHRPSLVRRHSSMASVEGTARLFKLSKTNSNQAAEITRRSERVKGLVLDVQSSKAAWEALQRQAPPEGDGHTAAQALLHQAAKSNLTALISLATHHAESLEHRDAAQHFQLALELAGQLADTAAIYQARHGLATSLHNCGDYHQAAALWESQLQSDQVDPDIVANTRRGKAATALAVGQAQAAWDTLVDVEEYYIKKYGRDQPPLMDICDMMAAAYWLMGPDDTKSLQNAANYYQKAWLLRREHQNTNWPQYLVTLHNYAELRMALGQCDDAERLWRELIGTCLNRYGAGSAPMLIALVGWADSLEPDETAEEAYEQARKMLGDRKEGEYELESGERATLLARVEKGLEGIKDWLVHRGGPWGPPRMIPLTLRPDTESY